MTRIVPTRRISIAIAAAVLVLLSSCGGGGSGGSSSPPAAVTHLLVSAPATAFARASLPFTVTALDASNNTVTSYTGSVHIASSDGQALLPPAAVALQRGSGIFNATLESAGTQTLTATDTAQASIAGTSAPITVSAAAVIAITAGVPPVGVVGSQYNSRRVCRTGGGSYGPCGIAHDFLPSASGGVGTFTWTWAAAPGSQFPPGLTLDDNLVSGTPPVGSVGSYSVIVTATDSGTPAAQATLTLTISIVNPPAPVIATVPGPQGATLNQPYSYQFQVSGFTPALSETGALPAGLAPLSATGVLAGTPTSANLYPITIHATDPAGQDTSQTFTIGVFQHGFATTGAMRATRTLHTATLLASGQVLLTGGTSNDGGINYSSELFTPTAGTFATTGALQVARYQHSATLLCELAALPCSNPKVLVVGGKTTAGAVASAELYDPTAGTFTLTVGSLATPRYGHTATRLLSGKVLIAGGNTTSGTVDTGSVASAELFDPATGTFTATAAPMASARFFHTATLLPDGRVLISGGVVAGGVHLDSAEIFDPVSRTFSTIPSPMTVAREGHTATLLPGGKVLIAGGLDPSGAEIAAAEIYDPAAVAPAVSFTATGALVAPRWAHSAVLLPSGQVLIAGGSIYSLSLDLQHAELYDPASGVFAPTGGMQGARINQTLTSLGSSGKVLVAGGDNSLALNTAELYQ
jgi:hypothetical protein